MKEGVHCGFWMVWGDVANMQPHLICHCCYLLGQVCCEAWCCCGVCVACLWFGVFFLILISGSRLVVFDLSSFVCRLSFVVSCLLFVAVVVVVVVVIMVAVAVAVAIAVVVLSLFFCCCCCCCCCFLMFVLLLLLAVLWILLLSFSLLLHLQVSCPSHLECDPCSCR